MSWTSLCITPCLAVNNLWRRAHALPNRQRLLSKRERPLDCSFCGLPLLAMRSYKIGPRDAAHAISIASDDQRPPLCNRRMEEGCRTGPSRRKVSGPHVALPSGSTGPSGNWRACGGGRSVSRSSAGPAGGGHGADAFDRRRMTTLYLYLAAVMNWLNDSHQTMTVVNWPGSIAGGTGTMKLWKVFTSPTRTIWGLRRAKSASVSTNSGDR